MVPDPVLHGWRPGALLGEGRLGVVVRGRRDGDAREYALKQVRSVDPAVRARFSREIEGLARLDHPNIAKLHDAGVSPDMAWLVMDLAEGRALSALRAPPGLDPGLVLGIGHQLADALAHAHARGVLHRDIKPSNAVIDAAGHVVLVDFGVALLDRAAGLTLEGHRPGTPVYAPPEWFGDGPVDGAAADVYALGVVLYELVTGSAAFSPARAAVLGPEKAARSLTLPSGPEPLATWIRAATDPDPERRPTARALADALAAWPPVAPPVMSTIAASLGLGTASTLDEPVGPRIGRYAVDHEIGRGGMGVVYRAHDPLLDRAVAIKRLFATTDAARARFAREARSVARLDHPGVVRVLDFGVDAVGPFFAMELVEGPDLATALATARVSSDRAIAIAIAVGEALSAAHAAGIVHRDVKPANVLLEGGVRPRLGDFGVATVADETRLTRADGVVGTPAYMAPEQAAGRAVDARADVYGLGAVLFELLVGEPPGPAGEVPPSLPGVEASLAAVVRRALEPATADRYPTMDRFVEDLRRIRDGQPIAPLALGARLHRAWRRPAVRVLAAGGLLLAVAAAVPILSAGVRWGEQAVAERAAEARRVAMEAEIARYLAEGHAPEADRAFASFAAFPAHEGTAALGVAWQGQAARLDARDGDEAEAALAWAQAWATAVGPTQQAGALLGLGNALVRVGRPAALGHVVALGKDVGPELDGLRRAWSLWRRAPDPKATGAADRLVAGLMTGTRPPWSVFEMPAVIDDDGDGLTELYLGTPDALLRLPGGRWSGAATPTGLGGAAELFPVQMPGVGPMLVANGVTRDDPKRLITLGPGGARVVFEWTAADVASAHAADLDHDGLGELYVATRYPKRTLSVLTVRDGVWRARALRAPSATNSTVDGMVLLEPVAQARSIVALFGAFGAYDVRRLVSGADGVVLDRRRKIGWPGGAAVLRGPDGARWLALGVKRGPPDPFPPDVLGLGDGLFVLDGRFAVLGADTPPDRFCETPIPADLDGDEVDELVARCNATATVADVGPTGALDAAHVGAMWPFVAGDADGDGDDEVVAWVGARNDDVYAHHETWVLGTGTEAVPPVASPAVRPVPAAVDAGLQPWWQRAEELLGMELFEAAEARFEAIASLDVDGPTGTAALMRAAEIADDRGAAQVAAERRTRAAQRPSAPPEVLLSAADAFAARLAFAEAGSLLRGRSRRRRRSPRGPGAADRRRQRRARPRHPGVLAPRSRAFARRRRRRCHPGGRRRELRRRGPPAAADRGRELVRGGARHQRDRERDPGRSPGVGPRRRALRPTLSRPRLLRRPDPRPERPDRRRARRHFAPRQRRPGPRRDGGGGGAGARGDVARAVVVDGRRGGAPARRAHPRPRGHPRPAGRAARADRSLQRRGARVAGPAADAARRGRGAGAAVVRARAGRSPRPPVG